MFLSLVFGGLIFVFMIFFLDGSGWQSLSDEFIVLSCMSWRSHGKFCVNGVMCMTIPYRSFGSSFIFGRGLQCD